MPKPGSGKIRILRTIGIVIFLTTLASGASGCEQERVPDDSTSQEQPVAVPNEVEKFDLTDIRFESDYEFEPVNVRMPEGDGPRLLCDASTLAKFSQPRDSLRFRTLMDLAQGYWREYQTGDAPDYPSAPAVMALAAHLTGNEAYLTIAADLILESTQTWVDPFSLGLVHTDSWTAIGFDLIRQKLSPQDRAAIMDSAHKQLEENRLPLVKMLSGKSDAQPYYFALCYAEALLWELAFAEEESRIEELILAARPVLKKLWDGTARRDDGSYAMSGLYADSFWLAVQACEYMGGAEVIPAEDIPFDLSEYEKLSGKEGYSPEALIRIAVKMGLDK